MGVLCCSNQTFSIENKQKDNTDPCEICGVVISRKSDIPRHAKTHGPDDEYVLYVVAFNLCLMTFFRFFTRKLTCPWGLQSFVITTRRAGCDHKTLQQSNMNKHFRSIKYVFFFF